MTAAVTERALAVLVLEDGTVFRGAAYGTTGSALGEVVFSTNMTGYQETLTDPSYHRQIVVQTAPHIGNTGWNDEDGESDRIWVSGYVVREPARVSSGWQAARSLDAVLAEQGVVGISEVDTRALTRHLRAHGTMRAGVFSGSALATGEEMVQRVLDSAWHDAVEPGAAPGTVEPYVVPAQGAAEFRVAVLDLGVRSSVLRMLTERGIEAQVLPAESSVERIMSTGPDGVLLSNGPGDPAAMAHVTELTVELLRRRVPLFGICLGHQLLGRALGLSTHRMRCGHRGANVPVRVAATGRVVITSQNHGFALTAEPGQRWESEFGEVEVTHHCLNDGTVEGLRCLRIPAFGVQYHPGATAGPWDRAGPFDAGPFDRFREMLAGQPVSEQKEGN